MAPATNIERVLGVAFNVKVTNVPELDHPVAVVLDYSPTDSARLLSIALGLAGERKCWLTASEVRKIGDDAPSAHPAYHRFDYANRHFWPYSIAPLPADAFDCVSTFGSICHRLYSHVVWR